MSQRPDLTQLIQKNHNPFIHQQSYPALVSVRPDGNGWKDCQRLWLFNVTVQPIGKNGNLSVGAKFAMFKYGLPDTGLRLSEPNSNKALLMPIISIAIPTQMLEIANDGVADWYTTYSGRATGNLSEVSDLLEKRF